MLSGHLAVCALEHRYVKAAFVPIMAAAVFPDILDKTTHYALDLTNSGRMWGHTLLAALITSGVVLILWGKRAAASWALGHLSHLVCDVNNVVPWLYPLVTYEFPVSQGFRATLWASLTDTPRMLLETSLSVWALVAQRASLRALTLELGHIRKRHHIRLRTPRSTKTQDPFCSGRCHPRPYRGPRPSSCRAFSRGARWDTGPSG